MKKIKHEAYPLQALLIEDSDTDAELIYTANGTANTVVRILFMYPVLP